MEAAEPPVKKRLGRPPKNASSTNGPAPRRGRPPLVRDVTTVPVKGRLGRPPGPARLLQLQQLGILAYQSPTPSSKDSNGKETLADAKNRAALSLAPSCAESNLNGLVVLSYPPHPWRWAPGSRRGDIVWTEMVHPLIRQSQHAIVAGGANSTVLWPAEVVDRWISDPRQPIDPRLAVINAAAEGRESTGFDVAVSTEDSAASAPFDQSVHIDLLDTLARSELKQILENKSVSSKVEASKPCRDASSQKVVQKPRIVISSAAGGDGNKDASYSMSADGTPNSSVEVSDASEDEQPAAKPVGKARIMIPPPQKRGRFRLSYKTLMTAHVPLQDPTGTTSTAAMLLQKAHEANLAEYEGHKINRKRRLEEMEGQPKPLNVHYVLRPLPQAKLGVAASLSLSLKGNGGDSGTDAEAVASGCIYRKAEEVLPFALYNPDCREDIAWNVAAMQAMDVAGSWGCPSIPGQDAAEPEECGLWGSVIEAMNLPPRPTDLAPNLGEIHPTLTQKPVSKPKIPHSFNIQMHSTLSSTASSADEGSDAEALAAGADPSTTATSGKINQDVWGLKKEPSIVPNLLVQIGASNWGGSDTLRPPVLGRFDSFLQRFRLGSERIQVGDLVRLSGKSSHMRGAYGRLAQRRALVVPREKDLEKLKAEQKKRFDVNRGAASNLRGVFDAAVSIGVASKTEGPGEVLKKVALKIDENGIASVVEYTEEVAVAGNGNENPELSSVPDVATAGEAPYGITLPATDGVDYLEVSYIVLRRPQAVAPIPWRGEKHASCSVATVLRPSVHLTGRVYHRIPADGRASRDVPLWYPTGEIRTVNAVAGEVLCRAHAQFPNPTLTGMSATGGAGGWNVVTTLGQTTTTWAINVGGVGQGWKGAGVEETTFCGNRLTVLDERE
ncbi:hypothetical protein CcCBS67573_g02063 [Chytriomyces confervae]|uniref:Uncharacterized protein n=1 Tax=Chytriomyces confervae TaxID=246404 RepID=A0A507FK62_9FUNG|nr:hypothetical protein CcCBS67573_g02063 [Chytriomyces confervae]